MDQAMIGVILFQMDQAQIDEIAEKMTNKWGHEAGEGMPGILLFPLLIQQ